MTSIPVEMAPVVTDGSGDRYLIVGVTQVFRLQSEKTGNVVAVDEDTMRKLNVDVDSMVRAIALTRERRDQDA